MAKVTNMNGHSVTLGHSGWTGMSLSNNGMSRGSSQKDIAGWDSQGIAGRVSQGITGRDLLTSPHNHRGGGSIHTSYVGSHTHYILCVRLQPIYFSHRGISRNQLRFLCTWDQGWR